MPIWDSTIRTKAGAIRVSDTRGGASTIVMIHGSGSTRDVFARQFSSALQDAHRLVAFDLPGHGASDDAADPAGDYSIPGLAAVAGEVLDALKISRPVVLGWSLGGHVAIELMARRELAGLMLTGTPPISPGPIGMLRGFQTNLDLLLAAKERFSERDALRFYEMCFHGNGDPRFLEAIRRADGRVRVAVSRSLMQGEGADQKRTVESASIPVAMVNGTGETVARLSYLRQLDYRALWGNSCHVIADAGHASFWDQPELFNRLLLRFAADLVKKPAAEARRASAA